MKLFTFGIIFLFFCINLFAEQADSLLVAYSDADTIILKKNTKYLFVMQNSKKIYGNYQIKNDSVLEVSNLFTDKTLKLTDISEIANSAYYYYKKYWLSALTILLTGLLLIGTGTVLAIFLPSISVSIASLFFLWGLSFIVSSIAGFVLGIILSIFARKISGDEYKFTVK